MKQKLSLYRLTSLLGVILLSVSVISPIATALSAEQKRIFNLGIGYYDVEAGNSNTCSGSEGSITLTGSDHTAQMFNFFKTSMGYTDQQAAGAVGSLTLESQLSPTAHNPSGAFGIAQWLGGRLTNLKKFGGSQYNTFAKQVAFVKKELSGPYKTSVNQRIKKTTTYQDAQKIWTWYYEGLKDYPDQWFFSKRNSFAQQALSNYGSGTASGPTTTTGGNCSTGSTASPNCQNAVGNTKIICEAKKYDTLSYSQAWHSDGKSWHERCSKIGPSCATDCSGLVNLAVYDAFGFNINENTGGERADIGKYWKKIPFSEAKPGDIVQPEPGHVEIIDHIVGKKVYAFAAHTNNVKQERQVGEWDDMPDSPSGLFLRYIGPGSSA